MSHLAFWFEFGSTYSYLSAMRIEHEAKKQSVDIIWKPFLLGPIFKEFGWNTSPFEIFPQKGQYMWRDMERQAEKYGLPQFVRPVIFPQHSLLAARIATFGEGLSWMPEFSKKLFSAQFAQGHNISDENILLEILESINLDGKGILAQVKNDEQTKNTLRQRTEEARKLGIFGAPSFITNDGELFWGNDRLEDALEWTKSL